MFLDSAKIEAKYTKVAKVIGQTVFVSKKLDVSCKTKNTYLHNITCLLLDWSKELIFVC